MRKYKTLLGALLVIGVVYGLSWSQAPGQPPAGKEDASEAQYKALFGLMEKVFKEATTEDVGKLQAALDAYFKLGKPDEIRFSAGINGAMVFEAVGATDAAVKLFARLRDDYAKADPRLSKHAAMRLSDLEKRAAMIGKPLEIKGTLTNGEKFDLANTKSKAVLVDCWATWCGPCVKEIPNLKKTYEKYHKQGFDIVGISGDENRQDLDTFLKNEKLPWGTIFGRDAFSILEKYNVRMFPTTMLVGPNRKVVGLNLRGGLLQDKLSDLLKPKSAGPTTPVVRESKE